MIYSQYFPKSSGPVPDDLPLLDTTVTTFCSVEHRFFRVGTPPLVPWHAPRSADGGRVVVLHETERREARGDEAPEVRRELVVRRRGNLYTQHS